MRKLLLLSACIVLLSVESFAQKGEAYFGFSAFTAGKVGWNGSAGLNLGKIFLVEGDAGGYYSHDNSIHSFMAGVKAEGERRTHGFTPWGHFLFGGSHVGEHNGSSDTAFSWAIGGGVDTNVYRKFALRLSADVFHTHFFNDGDYHLRAGAGVVYRF